MGNDRTDMDGQGNGQQGTGGLGSGRATSTPNPPGSQPHLGSAAPRSAQSAPGGTGQTEGTRADSVTMAGRHEELDAIGTERIAGSADAAAQHRDRLDTIELADDRTEALNPHRGAAANDESGGLGDVLAGPPSNEGYIRDANRETPILGATDDDTDNM